jgi:hypothetical protein
MTTKEMTGSEFYDYAVAKATEWNHGTRPEISIVNGFLFNCLHYPKAFGLGRIKIISEKD